MILTGCIILFIYVLFIGYLLIGYNKVPDFNPEAKFLKNRFSIVIPFRNEAENLPSLIQSLQKLKYPKELFEIIFVNDDTEDNSVEIIETSLKIPSTPNMGSAPGNKKLEFRIIKNKRFSKSPKKDAIITAIEAAKFEWIFTTDADCILNVKCLIAFNDFINKNDAVMVAGPVQFVKGNGLLHQFQEIDNFSLQSATLGGFGHQQAFICNGANLMYRKNIFKEVQGFTGNNNIASGDDIFLLEKIKKKYPSRVYFIKAKEAVVITYPQKNLWGIFQQRIRWASKISKQENNFSKGLGLAVFLSNLFVITGTIFCFINTGFIPYYFAYLFIKIILDLLMIGKSSKFFGRKLSLLFFIISEFIYPLIVVIVVIGNLNGTYSWKGRKFNK